MKTYLTGVFHSLGGSVKRAKMFEFYSLGRLQVLRELSEEAKREEQLGRLLASSMNMASFVGNEEHKVLPGAFDCAIELQKRLHDLTTKAFRNEPIRSHEFVLLHANLGKFENLLEYDLKRFPTYSVEKSGIFESDDLIEHADNHLSESALLVVNNQTKDDLKAAGRCLAFDLFTACGFHAVRALEATARVYYKQLTGRDAEQEGKPLGGVANEFRKIADDPVKPLPKDHPLRLVISNLDRMNNIYRKPITHPEMVVLRRDDAKKIFDLTAVSITQLADLMAATP